MWLKEQQLWAPAHMNVRDDRVEDFGSVYPGQTAQILVAVRAASPGQFVWPAPSAEAMYDPNVFARLPNASITIEATAK